MFLRAFLFRNRLTVILLLISTLNIFSQTNSKTDSLRAQLHVEKEDTSRIKILFELGNQFFDGPSDSLIHYYIIALDSINSFFENYQMNSSLGNEKLLLTYKQFHFRALNELGIENFFQGKYSDALNYHMDALDIAEEINDIALISECFGSIGIVYKNQGKYLEALPYYQRALDMAIELKDTSWIAACYSNAGNVYRRIGNYQKALEYHLKALEVFEQIGEKRRVSVGLMNIGNIYEDQKDYNRALEYHSQALQLSHETNDYKRIAECLVNVGNIYSSWGSYSKAREYYENSLQIHIEHGFRYTLSECYKHIGLTYEREGNLNEAVGYFNKALELAEKEDDKSNISQVMGYLAEISIQQKAYNKAFEFASNSLEIALHNRDLQNVKNAYLYLSEAEEGKDNIRSSLKYFKQYSSIKDSLFSAEKYRSITEVEAKYEVEKKEQQVALLTEKNQVHLLTISKRNRVLLTSLIVIFLLIVIGYILLRNSRLKSKQQAIELEQKLLRSQMNPHFIFNSLMAIQSYIYRKEPVLASDFLAKFADLVRITLENSRVEFVKLEKELKMLQVFIDLQLLRFDNKFDYTITVDDQIDIENTLVPPMMAQPFVENAIEHGLRHRKDKGNLKIIFSSSGHSILCIVEDDGVGRRLSKELEIKRKHQSMATSITKERLGVLSKRFGKNYFLEIEDMKKEGGESLGTKVNLFIPYKINISE